MKQALIEFYLEWYYSTMNSEDMAQKHNMTVQQVDVLLDLGADYHKETQLKP